MSVVLIIAGNLLVSAALGYGGSWLAFMRQPPPSLDVWYLRHGIVWYFNERATFWHWNEIDFVSMRRYLLINIGLRLPFANERTWFSVFNTRINRNAVGAVEITASTARLPSAVQEMACGRSVIFGRWSINATDFVPGANPIKWTDVKGIEDTGNAIIIQQKNAASLKISKGELPFPSLFTALARGLIAYWNDRSSEIDI